MTNSYEKPPEDDDYSEYADFYKPEPEIPANERMLCVVEVQKFQGMIASFEKTYSLEALHSITELTAEEAKNHPIREPARIALIPIVESLKVLKNKTDISTEDYDELFLEYKKLSRAVGIINNNKVDHDR